LSRPRVAVTATLKLVHLDGKWGIQFWGSQSLFASGHLDHN
jgi:hypothetical protein